MFLDGELYRDRLGSPALVEALEAAGEIAPALVVHVSHASLAARWVECPCHPPFARFVLEELMPWLETVAPTMKGCRARVLIGLSYTGLAASFVALQPGSPFTTVISQSGSYWWNNEWLTGASARLRAARPLRFLLEVGSRETQVDIEHKEDVHQAISQIDGVRRFRDAMAAAGHAVSYAEFDGGHEFDAWRRTLPAALRRAAPAAQSASL